MTESKKSWMAGTSPAKTPRSSVPIPYPGLESVKKTDQVAPVGMGQPSRLWLAWAVISG
jgi:hypothetical protein